MSNFYSMYQMVAESGLGIKNFYAANIFSSDVTLLGYYSKELYDLCIECNHKFEWCDNLKALKSSNGVLTVILTIKP
jgi:hypothetical protein